SEREPKKPSRRAQWPLQRSVLNHGGRSESFLEQALQDRCAKSHKVTLLLFRSRLRNNMSATHSSRSPAMRYNTLGQSGLFVSELCLGTMTFGGGEGIWGQIGALQQAEADALVKAALDAGINFVDTANVYAEGRSEEITGQALKNLGIKRDEV